jgi:hypothetical protein
MKFTKTVLLPATILCGALATAASAPAMAHGPRVSFGIMFGGPVWPRYYYPEPYYYRYYPPPAVYYPPAVVVVPSSPPVYVEQGQQYQQGQAAAPAAPSSDSSWYYCEGAQAYYPYVNSCPGGWQRVAPQPQ